MREFGGKTQYYEDVCADGSILKTTIQNDTNMVPWQITYAKYSSDRKKLLLLENKYYDEFFQEVSSPEETGI